MTSKCFMQVSKPTFPDELPVDDSFAKIEHPVSGQPKLLGHLPQMAIQQSAIKLYEPISGLFSLKPSLHYNNSPAMPETISASSMESFDDNMISDCDGYISNKKYDATISKPPISINRPGYDIYFNNSERRSQKHPSQRMLVQSHHKKSKNPRGDSAKLKIGNLIRRESHQTDNERFTRQINPLGGTQFSSRWKEDKSRKEDGENKLKCSVNIKL